MHQMIHTAAAASGELREQLAGLLQHKLVADQRSVLLQVDESVPVAHMIYVTDIAASLHAKVAVATSPTNARTQ